MESDDDFISKCSWEEQSETSEDSAIISDATNEWMTPVKCLKNNFNKEIDLEEESLFVNLHRILSDNNEEDNQSNDNENLEIETQMEQKENKNNNMCDVNNMTQDVLDRLLLLISEKYRKVRKLQNEKDCVHQEHKLLKEKINEKESESMNDTNLNLKLRNTNKKEKEYHESEIRRLEEEFHERTEIEKRLEDELEEKLNEYHAMKDECEDRVARADFIEDELENAFRKNKKLKKWIKAIENKCDTMHINSSGSDKSDESMQEENIM